MSKTHDGSIKLTFDGDVIEATKGEPVAAALVRAGVLVIARSTKFHRPRGPACFRAACDGCLARVDGVPNLMTCRMRARDGMVIESQNTLGGRDLDLLRVTDWFFAAGLNHHEILAGVPGVQSVMQSFARRVAGLGKLPAEVLPPREAKRISVDVLVVGGGPAGMTAAIAARRAGRSVLLVDDGLEPGGSAHAFLDGRFDALVLEASAIEIKKETTVAGFYGRDALVVGDDGVLIVEAKDIVLAPGAHDGQLVFENNDLPGIFSARAACVLFRHGVVPKGHIVIAISEGGGPFGEIYANALSGKAEVVKGEPASASGMSRIKDVTFKNGKKHKADVLVIDAPRAPSYELAEQAGAKVVHEPRGFRVASDEGKIADGLWVIGEAGGDPLDSAALLARANAIFNPR